MKGNMQNIRLIVVDILFFVRHVTHIFFFIIVNTEHTEDIHKMLSMNACKNYFSFHGLMITSYRFHEVK